jgi:hypothetical protein
MPLDYNRFASQAVDVDVQLAVATHSSSALIRDDVLGRLPCDLHCRNARRYQGEVDLH